jgi:Ca-activated chloride channel family protein
VSIGDFHFLRPMWLWAVVPALALVWVSWRQRSGAGWRRAIAPHLLSQLLTGGGSGATRPGPLSVLCAFWCAAIVALAGPAWERQATPFADERPALVIALHVGPTMLAQDVQPSRLERAVHKIRDLLARRGGARTALIAYAGTAHLVLPLTTDPDLITAFAAELSPQLMPRAGDAAAAAVRLGMQTLQQAGRAGTVLLVTDTVAPDTLTGLDAGTRVDILAVAAPADPARMPPGPPAPALDRQAMARAARLLGGEWFEITVDDSDVERLARHLERRVATTGLDETLRWKDAGYYLLAPLAILVLAWFRRGWYVRWEG